MSFRCAYGYGRFSTRAAVTPAVLAAVVLAQLPALAQPMPAEPRVPVGKVVSEPGTLLARAVEIAPWKSTAEVFSRDQLLALAGTRAVIDPAPASVRLTLWGNLPAQSELPLLESSAVLHDSRAFDLDLTLQSGRAVITNRKPSGPAKIWLRLPGEGWDIALDGPESSIALELYGRWPSGVPFTKDPLAPTRPISVLSFQVLKGHADVRHGSRQLRLGAPPGPAFLEWDSVGGSDSGPQRRAKLPDWAQGVESHAEDLKALPEVSAKYLEMLREKRPVPALQALLTSADTDKDPARASLTREFAVLGLAATNALPQLAEALATLKDAEARETVILAMRHWIGSAAGRDLHLYAMLVTGAGYTERQAETVMQLLHSPFDAKDPATYQTLIAYLQHDKPAIRELARWHLYRLVPQGAKIPYDAYGTPESRAEAAREWKQLIPDGELPKPKAAPPK